MQAVIEAKIDASYFGMTGHGTLLSIGTIIKHLYYCSIHIPQLVIPRYEESVTTRCIYANGDSGEDRCLILRHDRPWYFA